MNRSRALALLSSWLCFAALAGSCAGSPPSSGSVVTAAAPSSSPAAPSSTASVTAPPTPTATVSAPPQPTSCPSDMILVEGDYCSEVEQVCLKSWYDKSNRKKICLEFQPPTRCVGTTSKKRFCIDRYAWPNQKGVRPEVMMNFYQAQVMCASVGRRMCTESEWTYACEGPTMKPYPYGYVRDPKKCNGDHAWDGPNMKKVGKFDSKEVGRLWHGVVNGGQPQCVSDFGVPDLPGNTDDLASSETRNNMKKANFDNVTIGGPWYMGVRNQCRPRIYTHDEGFYYYFLSFRCCAEPDGAPSDPRAPKQIARGEAFKKIEGLAGFSVDTMKSKLELKRAGQCTCKDKDTLCKIMCGTVLGSNAVDTVLAP